MNANFYQTRVNARRGQYGGGYQVHFDGNCGGMVIIFAKEYFFNVYQRDFYTSSGNFGWFW